MQEIIDAVEHFLGEQSVEVQPYPEYGDEWE
jgi:hypothetical protein